MKALVFLQGKNTVINAFTGKSFFHTDNKDSINFKNLAFEGLNLKIWDLGGVSGLREYWVEYIENADGIVYVLDSFNKERIPKAFQEFKQLLKEEKLAKVPLVLLANKQDIDKTLPADDVFLSDLQNFRNE